MSRLSSFPQSAELSRSVSNDDSFPHVSGAASKQPPFTPPMHSPLLNTFLTSQQLNTATAFAQMNLLANLNTLFQPTIFSPLSTTPVPLAAPSSPFSKLNRAVTSPTRAACEPSVSFHNKKLSLISVPSSNCSKSVSNTNTLETSSQASETSTDRLARNRQTARIRRERKKHEAETLTISLSEQQNVFNKLQSQLSNLDKTERERIQGILNSEEIFKKTPRGCLFCDKMFNTLEKDNLEKFVSDLDALSSTTSETLQKGEEKNIIENIDQILLKHYHSEHSSDLKANSLSFGPSFDILTIVSSNSLENLSVPRKSDGASKVESEEERKKKRLEKNAQSAKLCRQRKKLYIQSLRLELPQLSFKNQVLQCLLNKSNNKINDNIIKRVDKDVKIPKLSGWDHTHKRYKRSSSDSSNSEAKKQKSEDNLLNINKLAPNVLVNFLLLNSLNATKNLNVLSNLNIFQQKEAVKKEPELKEESLSTEIEAANVLSALSKSE